MFAECIVDFSSKHQLFLVKLQKNLQIEEVLFVSFLLKFCGIAINVKFFFFNFLILKDSLCSLRAFLILLVHTLRLIWLFLFFTLNLRLDHVLNQRETFDPLLASFFTFYLFYFSLKLI